MTRSTLTALFFVSLAAVGCASAGDVAVVTSALEDTDATFDMVETHHEGLIEVELTVRGDGDERLTTYEWPETDEAPRELVAALAALDPSLLENAQEIMLQGAPFPRDATDVSPEDEAFAVPAEVHYVWPDLLEEAARIRLSVEGTFELPSAEGCVDGEGLSDCLRAAR